MKLTNKSFFLKDTIEVARSLLGCYLVRKVKNNVVLQGKIVETEAYLGVEDSCCHSFRGLRTPRNQAMYLEGGHAYIYFTYGMHHCLNVVTANQGQPEAVLIRALEPLEGLQEMQKQRKTSSLSNLTTGPAKLCQAFQITKKLNGVNLLKSQKIYIKKRKKSVKNIICDARIGLSSAKEHAYLPLRFFIKDNPFVSVKKELMK